MTNGSCLQFPRHAHIPDKAGSWISQKLRLEVLRDYELSIAELIRSGKVLLHPRHDTSGTAIGLPPH